MRTPIWRYLPGLAALVFSTGFASAATLTVTILEDEADLGLGEGRGDSLRECLDNSLDGDIIQFDPALFPVTKRADGSRATVPGTISLSFGELFVGTSVVINGPGRDVLTISGESSSRVLFIGDFTSVVINDLTIANGTLFSPGFFNDGGAGIYVGGVEGGADLSLNRVNVQNCTVIGPVGQGGPFIFGGGLYFAGFGNLEIFDCLFSNNLVEVDTQQPPFRQFGEFGVGGGGIFVQTPGTVTISDTTVSGNAANGGFGASPGGGGGILINDSSPTIRNSVISGNMVANMDGGGIKVAGESSVTILDSTISQNSGSPAGGGGIWNDAGQLVVNRCGIVNNTAAFQGGGIGNTGQLQITNSTISGNTSDFVGGGIFNENGTMTIINSTIVENQAGQSSTDDGGGIALSGDGGSTTIHNSIVANNFLPFGFPEFSGPDIGTSLFAGILEGQNNIIGVNTGVDSVFVDGVDGNQVGTFDTPLDPVLGPLADYGNGAMTHGLLLDSPALDRGNSALITVEMGSFDQRGSDSFTASRVFGASVDVGAYEVQDYDTDTIMDDEENTVPTRGIDVTRQRLPISPVTDGDGDGIVDSSTRQTISLQSDTPSKKYITVVAPDPLYFIDAYTVADPEPGLLDPNDFEYGFLYFRAINPNEFRIQQTAFIDYVFDVYYEVPLSTAVRYFTVGPSNSLLNTHLYGWSFTGSGSTGGEFQSSDYILLHMIQGLDGDLDLADNGYLENLGGPGIDNPLAVQLASFSATQAPDGSLVRITWETAAEIDTLGFNLYRAEPVPGGKFNLGEKLNSTLIPSEASEISGASYEYIDTLSGSRSSQMHYFLEDIDMGGVRTLHGPAGAKLRDSSSVLDWQLF